MSETAVYPGAIPEFTQIPDGVKANDTLAGVGNLIKLLAEYGRLAVLPEIAAAFEQLKAEDEGSVEAEIIAAAQPSDALVASVVKQLQTRFGKTIDAHVKLDPALIGGLKIGIGDTVIDASVRGQLQELAYSLKG